MPISRPTSSSSVKRDGTMAQPFARSPLRLLRPSAFSNRNQSPYSDRDKSNAADRAAPVTKTETVETSSQVQNSSQRTTEDAAVAGFETPLAVSRAIRGLGDAPSTETPSGSRQRQGRSNDADEGDRGVFSWSDEQLAERFSFDKEIGFGNWGSCWLATSHKDRHVLQSGKRYAIKLVHRQGTSPSNARVKALWNEYKVLRACGKPTHPNLVHFKEFIITPSYALVVMDYYKQAMNVALPISLYAGPSGYFFQLMSSISWLHERNVTHCDIKVANLLVDMTHDKVKGRPILVDFGFATLHDEETNFHSTQTWGTPEYLSPERSRGDLHDERLSDMWALGVTMFEIATGRTPFEREDEQFLTKEQLDVYYKRTLSPEWIGDWSIPPALEKLCKRMLAPEPSKRIHATDALSHPFFRADDSRMTDLGDLDTSLREELTSDLKRMQTSPILTIVDKPDGPLTSRSSRGEWEKTSVQASEAKTQNTPDNALSPVRPTSAKGSLMTPPIKPRKDTRREQVRIVVDDDEEEEDMSKMVREDAGSDVSEQGGGETAIVQSYFSSDVSIMKNPDTSYQADESAHKSTRQSEHNLSSTDAVHSRRSTNASSNSKRKGYPPSTSKTRKLEREETSSSSEQRHSKQSPLDRQYVNQPLTVHGTTFNLEAGYRQDDRSSHRHQDRGTTMSPGFVSTSQGFRQARPRDDSGDATWETRTPHGRNTEDEGHAGEARTPDLGQIVRQVHEYQTAPWLQPKAHLGSNGVDIAPEELDAKLAHMDDLAAALASMVKETRSVLEQMRSRSTSNVAASGTLQRTQSRSTFDVASQVGHAHSQISDYHNGSSISLTGFGVDHTSNDFHSSQHLSIGNDASTNDGGLKHDWLSHQAVSVTSAQPLSQAEIRAKTSPPGHPNATFNKDKTSSQGLWQVETTNAQHQPSMGFTSSSPQRSHGGASSKATQSRPMPLQRVSSRSVTMPVFPSASQGNDKRALRIVSTVEPQSHPSIETPTFERRTYRSESSQKSTDKKQRPMSYYLSSSKKNAASAVHVVTTPESPPNKAGRTVGLSKVKSFSLGRSNTIGGSFPLRKKPSLISRARGQTGELDWDGAAGQDNDTPPRQPSAVKDEVVIKATPGSSFAMSSLAHGETGFSRTPARSHHQQASDQTLSLQSSTSSVSPISPSPVSPMTSMTPTAHGSSRLKGHGSMRSMVSESPRLLSRSQPRPNTASRAYDSSNLEQFAAAPHSVHDTPQSPNSSGVAQQSSGGKLWRMLTNRARQNGGR